ncbi:(2Fe-2S)-binding protein [Tianweitania sp. BSSL-BM11]|uniref:(2Fe-2S)-binding protein n=1 Tax=Tianweitania aestuarii TaxID=2814886 RepID=A0ABS5RY16_9HYPH|nr:2Fe-2S iron-sulfur cluster-binding protein [Tianweitania aestuarii]MBS9721938.1 (2Fe-2S)-binding protein [Tianweitania aestuarii]
MTSHRIGSLANETLHFTFDGTRYDGRPGDTIASALLANGVRVVGRSFKYHRPRGIMGYSVEEPNALVDVTLNGVTTPNLRATTEALVDGMVVRAVNASPTAAGDRKGFLDRFAALLPAGFYYKTFIWPDWHRFEPSIRAMAGLGRLDPTNEPPAQNPQIAAHCDVLVIGGGPAGLHAATQAASEGRSVMLVDDQQTIGGSLLFRHAEIDGKQGGEWASAVAAELTAQGHRVLANTTAYGVYDHNLVALWQRRLGQPDAQWRVRARRIVLAAGAIERPLLFPDNDRPGIMLADAALSYLAQHKVLVGRRIVLATNNGRAYPVAEALRAAGADVTIADLRQQAHDGAIAGARIEAVHGSNGVEAVTVSGQRLAADCLLMSGGLTPSVHLYCQAGGKLAYDETIAAFVPREDLPGMRVVGAASGHYSLAEILGGDGPIHPYAIAPAWPEAGVQGRQWVDFQNDVTVKDIALAERENFRAVEHLKRYTTLGMATDQGKTSNMNGLATMAALTGRTIPQTGTTTYRPPFVPVPFGVVAGRRRGEFFNPVRRLVLENEHREAGATFREYGGWLRPAWFGGANGAANIRREAIAARTAVAILDGSPLGKIEVIGPDAGALVDYNSYNTLSTLKPGRIRYGFMLTESGVIYDDGVTTKIADDHYVVSCSSGHVAGVVARLEEWRQDRFDPARVFVHNSTPQWATLTASGPRARKLVSSLSLGVDLDDAVLPHMAFADGQFDGAMARVSRVSFTGDRSYEIAVPSSKAANLLAAMREAGKELDAVLMGSEALLLLRAEKGYLIAGKDTDGTTMPHDLGITGPMNKRQNEYVGRRSLFTDNAQRADRQQLVGLTVEGQTMLPVGTHGVETVNNTRRSIGFVTSSYESPTLNRPIALGLIERGMERKGEMIDLVHLGQVFRAEITDPCAFDPEGARLNA